MHAESAGGGGVEGSSNRGAPSDLTASRHIYMSQLGAVEQCSRQKEILILAENVLDQEEFFCLSTERLCKLAGAWDHNTCFFFTIIHVFFHSAVTARKKRNNIKKLLHA